MVNHTSYINQRGTLRSLSPHVILNEVKDLGNIHFGLRYATGILPPFGRLDDRW
jgi:hypothetical protein